MKVETIMTLQNDDRYYLVDETVQDGKKYFLANKLDKADEMTDKSSIFEEIIKEGVVFIDEVKDIKLANYIAAIFTAKFIENIDENIED